MKRLLGCMVVGVLTQAACLPPMPCTTAEDCPVAFTCNADNLCALGASSSPTVDASTPSLDAGTSADASSAADAATAADAAGMADASLPPDAAGADDAAVAQDAASPPDASVPDAAAAPDAAEPDAAGMMDVVAVLSGAPTGASNVAALDVTVGGAGVARYLSKVVAGDGTDCALETGYSSARAISQHITDALTSFVDGPVTLCVRGQDASSRTQSADAATTATWQRDTTPPHITAINSLDAPVVYFPSDLLRLQVVFDEPVSLLPGMPTTGLALPLDTGRPDAMALAAYNSGLGTGTLQFRYTVVDGDGVEPLNNMDTLPQLVLPSGASLVDAAGNVAVLEDGVFLAPATTIILSSGSASSVCDTGSLRTTCTVSSEHMLTPGAVVGGKGSLVVTGTGALRLPSGSGRVLMGRDVTVQPGGTLAMDLELLVANVWNVDGMVSGRINARVATLNVGATGTLVSNNGFAAGMGPGAPVSNAGAGHGAAGGEAQFLNPAVGPANDDADQPLLAGSGGGMPGGGVIRVVVSGAANVQGIINANAVPSATQGGGAGGSIWFTAATLVGTGTFSATGGAVTSGGGGGGGGGRIKIEALDLHRGPVLVDGGTTTQGGRPGGLGTYRAVVGDMHTLCDMGRLDGTCTLTSSRRLPDQFNITGTGNLTLANGGALRRPVLPMDVQLGGDLTVQQGGVVEAPLGNVGALNLALAGSITGGVAQLTVVQAFTVAPTGVFRGNIHAAAADITVAAGGLINADALGDVAGAGAGTISGSYGGGGGHGGAGGTSGAGAVGGQAYGNPDAPDLPGSGGGTGGGGVAGRGGGVIRLSASRTLTLAGTLSADGGSVATNSGGGSGGSIWVDAPALSGLGTLRARGGAGNGASGGGGRIAVHGDVYFRGTVQVEAAPQVASAQGEPGSYRGFATQQDSMCDGGGTLATSCTVGSVFHLPHNVDVVGAGSLNIVAPGALKRVGPPAKVEMGQDLTVGAGAGLEMRLMSLKANNLTVGGTITGSADNVVVTGDMLLQATAVMRGNYPQVQAGTFTMAQGSRMDASALGSFQGQGAAGAGETGGSSQGGGGGGHGGAGGMSSNGMLGGATHGSADMPVTPGGAGGGGGGGARGGNGGGVIKVTSTGAATVSGTIVANGQDGAGTGGGGAGGSVWLVAQSLDGNGTLAARGGNSNGLAGAGGGGRVVAQLGNSTFSGTLDAAGGVVNGGFAGASPGAAGSVMP